MADLLEEASVIVTVIMVDSVQDRAVEEAQKPTLLRKISSVANLLSLSSPNVSRMQVPERDPAPIRNTMLSSDLLIHPPCNGKFIAELPLRKILGNKQKDLVVKVTGARLEILFAEKTQGYENRNIGQSEKINDQERGKFFRNIFLPLFRKMKMKNSDVDGSKKVEMEIENRNLKSHGQILLPDFINPETLEFSINILGNLNIQADVKGAIPVVSSAQCSSTGMHEGTTTRQGVFKKWVSVKCKEKKGKEKNKNNVKRVYNRKCSWDLKNSVIYSTSQA